MTILKIIKKVTSLLKFKTVKQNYILRNYNLPYFEYNIIVLVTSWYENRVTFSVYDVDEHSWFNQEKQLILKIRKTLSSLIRI